VVADAVAAGTGRRPGAVGVVSLRLACRPEPTSRVRLGRATDELGLPRLEVDWRLAEGDRDGLARAVEVLADEWGAAGHGLLRVTHQGEGVRTRRLDVGAHHMGTLRMDDDPTRGVVDRHGRVHDVENLYVVGSATFPTPGWANPTLTVVALALRLGDHLASATQGATS
jgi:choline dehydrogenase-like flavoprotein